ncbi:uncharacterized protein STEHIDRAFT_50647, partial [Stereum hirsutum FP-91666 SS1]|uniref:uncharacterized protein n=1 Tax=Stereum hirsutum (strain FP-91666) TaxID=721885 RepID=UPI000440F517
MLAGGSSPPRSESPFTVAPAHSQPPPAKKRKTGHNTHQRTSAAASPAPSDVGGGTPNPNPSTNPGTENVLLPSSSSITPTHPSLLNRPRLTVSRGPVFIPISDASPYSTTDLVPLNRIGFRYTPAGVASPDATLPFRTIESAPQKCRVSWEDRSPFVRVTQDGLGLLGDKGFRSARMNVPLREGKWYVEVTVEHGGGARSLDGPGSYSSREGAHVRLGFGRREAPLNAPCGLDGYSYGIRDKTGEKVTLSRTRPYGRAFGVGDTIGMYISLPPLRSPVKNDPHDPAHLKRERIAIDFKGQEYWESLEYPQSKEMIALMDTSRSNRPTETTSLPSSTKKSATVKNVPERGRGSKDVPPEPAPMRPLPTLPNSQIAFFVNGESQGTAFRDLYDFCPLRAPLDKRKRDRGKRLREGAKEHTLNPFDDGSLGYYPLISLFNGARVRINPGPNFAFPPPPDIDATLNATPTSATGIATERTWRPLHERYPEYMDEQWAMDKRE